LGKRSSSCYDLYDCGYKQLYASIDHSLSFASSVEERNRSH
jgi:hypothetical protein